MKKEILDAPFRDSFSDFLEKGESVLWRGQPKQNSLFSWVGAGTAMMGVYMYSLFYDGFQNHFLAAFWTVMFVGGVVGLIAIFIALKNKKKRAIRHHSKTDFFPI